ncbi:MULTISPECIES: DoxX family membrane protein [Haloferax]|uniref:DoxX family membrane protein n=1 Tax=Haloferax marinum TaxID=2666143 RepID=A0A6A8G2L3_9EURY|nr:MULTISPECIES: DoxX family membrane protein [Haloferax]KAB1196331.1 DoxX family membrane protein [Haloferax sp. CBA1150]MRW95321.1 DoxX family membrane protein [Haloferax marinum]
MEFDGLSDRLSAVATSAPHPSTIARVSLGLMVLTAGVHKLLDPLAWTVYVVEWLAPLLVVTPLTFMLVNGVLEIGFGMAILTDRYTAFASAVAGVSLTATVLYLCVVFVLEGGLFGDVLVRDIGLAGLAWAVVVSSLRRSTRTA